jgi:cysteine-rich repeat protein
MQRVKEKHWIRIWGFGITVTAIVAAGAMSGSCVFDTRTNFCEQFGIRCGVGQECATDQAVCINSGGCGNNRLDPGEACDDGNIAAGDGCSADCTSNESCGNGIMDIVDPASPKESCDDGNTRASDGCSPVCQLEFKVCGNLIVEKEIGEVCDDGNQESFDGCRMDCISNEACGNNVIDAHLDEECEFADSPFPESFPDIAGCDNDCTLPECGDGHLNSMFLVTDAGPAHNEQCDSGVMGMRTDSPICDSDCTFISCGDDHTNKAAGEECDNGATDTGDGDINSNTDPNACRTNCRNAFCGDGVQDNGEMCDDDNNDNTDFCPSGINGTCKPAECGDGHVRSETNTISPDPEECDDGNSNNSDDCPDGSGGTCKPAMCGDGFRRTQGANPEQCDNGSANSDADKDACRTNCLTAHCGDQVKDSGEQCDPPITGICGGAGATCNDFCQCN